jgi:hypothetical protein
LGYLLDPFFLFLLSISMFWTHTNVVIMGCEEEVFLLLYECVTCNFFPTNPKKLCLERILVQIMVVNMVPWTSCKPLGHSNLSNPIKKHRLGVGSRGLGNVWIWLEQLKKSRDRMATCTIG